MQVAFRYNWQAKCYSILRTQTTYALRYDRVFVLY